MPGITENGETQGLDIEAASAEISAELFGQDESGNIEAKTPEGAEGETPATPTAVEEKPSPQPEGEQQAEAKPEGNSEEVQATGAPSTWSKEALADWATIPPRAQQEILKREQDMFRGLEQYKSAAEVGQKYETVVEPYRAVLNEEAVDPVQLFQSFAANHYLLSRGTPEQKLQIATNLIQSYNIDVAGLVENLGVMEPISPEVRQLQTELHKTRAQLERLDSDRQQTNRAQMEQQIEVFASDPAHPYFNELIDDIAKFLEAGAASLQAAYDSAVYANPVTRQKEVDRLTALKLNAEEQAKKTRADKIAASTAADVTTMQRQRNGTVPVGSMDDTLAETLASISARG